jgi:WD40 repeat protein
MPRRTLRWPAALAGLIGLGWGLYVLLPPEPNWTLNDCCQIDLRLADQGLLLTWHGDGADGCPHHPPLVLRDIRTGEPIRAVVDENSHSYSYLSPGGGWVAGVHADGRTVGVAPVQGGPPRIVTLVEGEFPNWCDLSPDGSILAVQLHSRKNDIDDFRYAIFDTTSGKEQASLQGRRRAQFTPDGKFLVILLIVHDEDESRLKVWDVRKGDWVIDYGPIAGTNGKIRISPDGRTLLGTFPIGDREFETAVWDLRTFQRTPLPVKTEYHWRHAVSASGRAVMLSRRPNWKSHVAVWDPEAGSWIFQFHAEESGHEVVLSADGKRLLFRSFPGGDMKCFTVFDVDTGRSLWSITEPAHMFLDEPAPVFSSDNQTLVIYRGFRQPLHADFVDVNTGKLLASLPIARAGWDAQGVVTMTTLSNRVQVVDVFQPSRLIGPWTEWLPQFLQPADSGVDELMVIDLYARTVRARFPKREGEFHFFDEGRSIITAPARNGGALTPGPVCCYDVPGHGPWRYVVGIPAALAGLIAGLATLRKIRLVRGLKQHLPVGQGRSDEMAKLGAAHA